MSIIHRLVYLSPNEPGPPIPVGTFIVSTGALIAFDPHRLPRSEAVVAMELIAFDDFTRKRRDSIEARAEAMAVMLGPPVALIEGATDPLAHIRALYGPVITTPEDRAVVRAYAPGVCVRQVRRYRRDTHDPTARDVQDLGVPAYLVLAEPGPGWNACALTPCPDVWVRLRSVEWFGELGEEHRCAREETDVVWWRRDLARDPSTARP